jgi:hypothetical protein
MPFVAARFVRQGDGRDGRCGLTPGSWSERRAGHDQEKGDDMRTARHAAASSEPDAAPGLTVVDDRALELVTGGCGGKGGQGGQGGGFRRRRGRAERTFADDGFGRFGRFEDTGDFEDDEGYVLP